MIYGTRQLRNMQGLSSFDGFGAATSQPLGFVPKSQPWLSTPGLWDHWSLPNADWLAQTASPNSSHYGDAAAPAPGQNPLDYVTTASAAVATYQANQDVRIMRAAYMARIQNYEAMKKQFPLLGVFYTNQINTLKAKVAAIDEKLALQVEGEAATRDWRSLGQTGVGIGILGGIALITLLTALTIRVVRG